MRTANALPNEAHRFATPALLAEALAHRIADILRYAVQARGAASLVVSGGSTPVAMFHALSALALPWEKVWITLADERWVPETDEQSNAALVREHLLRDEAAAARFVGLHTDAPDPFHGAREASERLVAMPRPFDAVVLGMGDDGHTASLFPRSPQLSAALEEPRVPACVGVRGDKPPRERITLSAPTLLASRWIALHVVGTGKWEALERAAAPGPIADCPVRAILNQRRVPVHVYWSP